MIDFVKFPKIARLSRDIVITEKIDGTNGCIFIGEDGEFLVGSQTRWITPEQDNHGFAQWAYDHKEELLLLGPGRHFGEWWGSSIQRGYGLPKGEKRFSLFNTKRWKDLHPYCCSIVPILYEGDFNTQRILETMSMLAINGSVAAPGFMKPEGVVIYHTAANVMFKKTFEKDEKGKGN